MNALTRIGTGFDPAAAQTPAPSMPMEDFAAMARHGATLDIRPRNGARPTDRSGWLQARQRLGMFAVLSKGWNGGDADPPPPHTVAFAGQQLAALCAQGAPPPIINPSPDGAIYAHWHQAGIDLEVIFEGPYQVVILLDDACGRIDSFEGEDRNLTRASAALAELARR